MSNEKTIERLEQFAAKYRLILETKGEVGFGRPCVGFLSKGGDYVDYNPRKSGGNYDNIWPYDARLCAPRGVEAFHKHSCLCVLAPGEDYDKALEELAVWCDHLEAQGTLRVESFDTGATGMQVLFSGAQGYAIRLDGEPVDE